MNIRNIVIWFAISCLGIIVIIGFVYFIRRLFFEPGVDASVDKQIRRTKSETVIQVSVLNGSGKNGLAKKATLFLRRRGYDVVETGNTDSVRYSAIIDYVGDTVSAMRVARAIGLDKQHIRVEIDSSLFLRCAIVLGKDYSSLKIFQ